MPTLVSSTGEFRDPLRRWMRILGVLAVYGGLLVAGHLLGRRLGQMLSLGSDGAMMIDHRAVWMALALYALLRAVPFVPSAQLALALLAAFGGAIALQVYLATVLALGAAFLVGRLVPHAVLARGLAAAGLERASDLVGRMGALVPGERLAAALAPVSRRLADRVVDGRHIALTMAFNVPGNCVLGGGGGIALLAGLSGVFSFPAYMGCVLLAALPVPLATLLASWLT
ncbi:MAG: hypothetical protein AB7O57_11170 [Hyphomicrobiaceae bacterium]